MKTLKVTTILIMKDDEFEHWLEHSTLCTIPEKKMELVKKGYTQSQSGDGAVTYFELLKD